MKYSVINLSQANSVSIKVKSEDPLFRKATRKMILSCAAFDLCLEPIKAFFTKEDKTRIGLVVGSIIGELESTKDFLLSWDQSKLARPLLFQNSLHNSSAGMIALHYGLTGPVITTSHPDNLACDSLSLAELMLSSGICSYVFVVNVETDSGILGYEGPPEGAYVLLIANCEAARASGLKPLNANVSILKPLGFSMKEIE